MPPLSQACPRREAADRCDRRDRARIIRLRLVNRQTGATHRRLIDKACSATHEGDHPDKDTSKAGQDRRHGHGQENPRRYYQPDLIRRWPLDRGSSATHHRSGGNQPAYQSMIIRRFMSVLPALPSGGCAEQLERQARNFRACSLKWRT